MSLSRHRRHGSNTAIHLSVAISCDYTDRLVSSSALCILALLEVKFHIFLLLLHRRYSVASFHSNFQLLQSVYSAARKSEKYVSTAALSRHNDMTTSSWQPTRYRYMKSWPQLHRLMLVGVFHEFNITRPSLGQAV